MALQLLRIRPFADPGIASADSLGSNREIKKKKLHKQYVKDCIGYKIELSINLRPIALYVA